VDLDGQIVDKDFARKALGDWFKEFANVRQMHSGSMPPAGIGVGLDEKPDGFYLKTEVYEPGAMLQVQKGGYKAYSIGIALPRVIRDAKAKNGRIVDGKVVENSLVDYPANLGTKFAIVEKMGGSPEGEMQLLFKSVKVPQAAKQKPPKVQVHGGKGDVHIHLHQPGEDDGDGGDGDSDGGDDGDGKPDPEQAADSDASAGGAAPGAPPALPMSPGFQSFYGGKQVTPEQAKQEAKRAKKEAKRAKILKAMLKGIEWKGAVPKSVVKREARRITRGKIPGSYKEVSIKLLKKSDVATIVQALHDLTCQVNEPGALKSMYPKVAKNGLAASLGPTAKLAIWQLIQNETVEDGGSGKSAIFLSRLGDAYDALTAYLDSEAAKPEIMFAAQDELHKAFLEINKDILGGGGPAIQAPASPNAGFGSATGTLGGEFSGGEGGGLGDGILASSPTVPSAEGANGSISPGQYRRAFLSGGHQRETGEGAEQSPWKPASAAAVDAGDFTRGYITDGHARVSPGDTKRAPIDLAQQLHDSLAIAFPNIGCYLEPSPGPAPMNAPSASMGDMSDGILGKSISTGLDKQAAVGTKKAVKKAKKAAKAEKRKLEKKIRAKLAKEFALPAGGATVAPAPSTEGADAGAPQAPVPAPPSKKKKGKSAKVKEASAKSDKTIKKMRKQLASFKKQHGEMKGELARLSSEPDPRLAPTRREALHKGLTAEAQKRKVGAVEADVQKRRAELEDQAINASDPQARDRAQLELMGLSETK
jgi:hypothetical protein